MNLSIKANFTKLLVSIFFICSIFPIQSYAESVSEILDELNLKAGLDSTSTQQQDEFNFLDRTYKLPAGLTKWEAQLVKTIENNQLLMRNGLELVDYKYVRNVENVSDLETVKRELNDDRSFFVVHNDDSYTIGENEVVSKNYMKFLDYLLPTSDSAVTAALYENDASSLANSVYIFEKKDMGIVGLTWQYKGETLHTTCLVSENKGVVFDKILFAILFERSKIKNVN